MPRENKCSETALPKRPTAVDLRKVVARLLGPYSKLGDEPPSYWPSEVPFRGSKKDYDFGVPQLLAVFYSYVKHVLADINLVESGVVSKIFSALFVIRPPDTGLSCCAKHDRACSFDAWVDEEICLKCSSLVEHDSSEEVHEEEEGSFEVETESVHASTEVYDGRVSESEEETQVTSISKETTVAKRKRSALSTRCASLLHIPFDINTAQADSHKPTSFYPSLSSQYTPLLAVFGSLFAQQNIADVCCGKSPFRVYGYLRSFKPRTIFLSDKFPAKGHKQLDLVKINWDTFQLKLDVIISSLPYARKQCEPLLAACLQSHAKYVCLKLLNSFERPAVGDERASALSKLAVKILLPPATYSGFSRALGEVEAWFIFCKSTRERLEVQSRLNEFSQSLYGGSESEGNMPYIFQGKEYRVSCFKERGLLMWDSRTGGKKT